MPIEWKINAETFEELYDYVDGTSSYDKKHGIKVDAICQSTTDIANNRITII